MRKIFLLLVVIFFGFVYSYNLIGNTAFQGDITRDMHDILLISQGDIKLIGPKLSFGGIYAAPWYYYLFVPIYLISGKSFESILYLNVLAHILALVFCFRILSKKGFVKSWLFILSVATLPLFVFSARNPGNAFTYQPMLICWLIYFFLKKGLKKADYIWAGLLAGFIASFHIITIILFVPIWLYVLIIKKRAKEMLSAAIFFSLPFVPLLIFELKHNFIMFKNTFIDQSYKMFTQNLNIPDRQASPKNIWQNLWFIHTQLAPWLGIGPIWLMVSGTIIEVKKIGSNKLFWYILTIYGFFVILSRYQFAIHYLMPLGLTVLIVTLIMLFNTKWFYFLSLSLIIVNTYSLVTTFSQYQHYHPNNYSETRNKAQKIVKKLNKELKNFNVVFVDKSGRSSIGHQFRYFFLLNSLTPNNEYEYASSSTLIVFTESNLNRQQLKKLDNYEVRQFGNKYLDQARKIAMDQKLFAFVLTK